MIDADAFDFQPFDAEDEDLVRRLRELDWPTVSADVRERCWRDFQLRLAGGPPLRGAEAKGPDDPGADSRVQSSKNISRRESFTRRIPLPRQPLAAYLRSPRQWEDRRAAPSAARRPHAARP